VEALRQGAFVGFVSASLSPFLNIYWITGAVVAGVFTKGPIGGTDNTDKSPLSQCFHRLHLQRWSYYFHVVLLG